MREQRNDSQTKHRSARLMPDSGSGFTLPSCVGCHSPPRRARHWIYTMIADDARNEEGSHACQQGFDDPQAACSLQRCKMQSC